jgi:acyl dehydratase
VNVLRLVHGEQEFEFHEPVRPGDLLETEGEITRLQERGNLDFLEVTSITTNQHGRLVVKGVWTAIIRN